MSWHQKKKGSKVKCTCNEKCKGPGKLGEREIIYDLPCQCWCHRERKEEDE